MIYIGSCFEKLEGWMETFSMEVFASILKRDWINEALQETGRKTQRDRKLPAVFTVWLTIAMGLYRNLSILNVLNRMGNVLGMGSVWSQGKMPKSSSVVDARDRVGFGPLRCLLKKFREWILEMYRESMSWKGHLLLALDGTTFKVQLSRV